MLISMLFFSDFNATDSFLAILEAKGFDFSNITPYPRQGEVWTLQIRSHTPCRLAPSTGPE
jgi:hypothetical protein